MVAPPPLAAVIRPPASPPARRARGLQHLAQRTYAIVLAGGRGTRLQGLTERHSKPALPFGGKLTIIDFTLSNCVNSGIRRIGVLTQYKAQSLIRHLEHGWGFLQPSLGEYLDVVPAQQQQGDSWYGGTADAVWQNVELIREARPDYVLVLAGDHVYKMDYSCMLSEHVASGADATVACIDVPREEACHFGVMAVDEQHHVVAFDEKPANPQCLPDRPDRALVSMGIYVFNAELLYEQLAADAVLAESRHDFGYDLIPRLIRSHRVHAHDFGASCVNIVNDRPYWRDVGTVDAYWEANMDLTRVVPELNLYDDDWPILSLQRQTPPAKFVFDEYGRRGLALDSLVSGGCIVSGATVRRSILFSKVHVGEHSLVEDSVVLPNVRIGSRVVLRRTVVDKGCILPDGFEAGIDPERDRQRFHVTERGITLVTLPAHLHPESSSASYDNSAPMPLSLT